MTRAHRLFEMRVLLAVAILLAAALLLVSCGGGDDRGDSGGDNGGASATQTPFIAPSPYTVDVALQKLSEIEQTIKVPTPAIVQKNEISNAAIEQRVALILNGDSDTTGLDDARAALNDGNRILAAEYIHNVVTDYVAPAFGDKDSDSIDEKQLDEIDPGHTFVDDHSQGMLVSGLYKEVAVQLIQLWYRVLPG